MLTLEFLDISVVDTAIGICLFSVLIQIIGIYMKNQGYNVILAANGKEGLEKIETNDIHLAIVDIMMPVMDGISMVMEARKHHDFPILFLSAKSEDIDKITGLNIGADDYITKPFQSMELVARVRSHLRRYEQKIKIILILIMIIFVIIMLIFLNNTKSNKTLKEYTVTIKSNVMLPSLGDTNSILSPIFIPLIVASSELITQ